MIKSRLVRKYNAWWNQITLPKFKWLKSWITKLLLRPLEKIAVKTEYQFQFPLPCAQKYSRLRCLLLCQRFSDTKLLLWPLEKIAVKTEYQFQFSLPCAQKYSRLRCLLRFSDSFIFTNPFLTYLKDVGVCKVLKRQHYIHLDLILRG